MASRRRFMLRSGAVLAAAAAGGCGSGSPTAPSIDENLPSSGSPNLVRIPLPQVGQTVPATGEILGLTILLAVTRTSESTVVAVSRRCTHEGCTVNLPAAPGRTLDCPCHGSRFTITGQVLNGPAERPLPSFPARIEGDEVVVTLP